ncbi:MAG: acyltransferase family protein [Firmicutes bacterium]|nr:acyltransferase family protein [Bacillota bacterium]
MSVILAILIIILISKSEFTGSNYNRNYLSRDTTATVNGIFVMLVFLSHYYPYIGTPGEYDQAYAALRVHLNQAEVVTFLFYSGYGIMESIKRKGFSYVQKLPQKALQLLFRFDTAVLLYLILDVFILHNGFVKDLKTVLLALLTWTSVGNSNWYITAVLCLYLLTFIAFLPIAKKDSPLMQNICTILLILFTMATVYVQMKLHRPNYCYNTMIMFPLGIVYSLHRQSIEKVLLHSEITFYCSFLLTVGLYCYSIGERLQSIEMYTLWIIAFMAAVVLLTMIIDVRSKFFLWLGNHVFSIYILQRIPMHILSHYGYTRSHKYFSLVLAFLSTVFIALLFEKATDWVINKLSEKRNSA